jgi:glutamine synthetase
VTGKEEILRVVRKSEISNVELQWIGVAPFIRSKVSGIDCLENHLRNGIGIGKIYESINLVDEVVPGFVYGLESSEFRILPDIGTFALTPYAPKSTRFICELKEVHLSPADLSTRSLLRRVLKKGTKEVTK